VVGQLQGLTQFQLYVADVAEEMMSIGDTPSEIGRLPSVSGTIQSADGSRKPELLAPRDEKRRLL